MKHAIKTLHKEASRLNGLVLTYWRHSQQDVQEGKEEQAQLVLRKHMEYRDKLQEVKRAIAVLEQKEMDPLGSAVDRVLKAEDGGNLGDVLNAVHLLRVCRSEQLQERS